jgi:hypothetical protein
MSFNKKFQFTEMKSFSKNIEQNIQNFKGKLDVEEFKAKVGTYSYIENYKLKYSSF